MQPSRVVFALAVAALSGSSVASARAALPDPCKLLTAQEVSAALGITSRPGHPFLGSHLVCYFAADTGVTVGSASVTLMVMTPVAFQNQGRLGGSFTSHSLTGIGDEAFYVGGGPYTKVCVRKGDRALSVTLVAGRDETLTPAQLLDKEKTLAQKAVARL